MTVDERFDAKWLGDPETGCHVWTGPTQTQGYGQFNLGGIRTLAHRFAYERAHGPIPEGCVTHHRCESKTCVNPDHLEILTRSAHLHAHPEVLTAGHAAQAAKTHCPHGHPYAGDNVDFYRGQRVCRTCNREKVRRYRARRAAA